MPSLTKEIPKNSDQYAKLLRKVGDRMRLAQKNTAPRAKWIAAEDTMLAYVAESDLDKKRREDREQKGNPRYTTIKIPYTFAVVMAAHTYLTSVFFARSPAHQYSGRHGEGEMQVQAVEALINYQTIVGEMLGPYYVWIYDSLKYGTGVIEEYWEEEIIQAATIIAGPDGKRYMARAQMEGYQGNKINNISPFDFYPDPRVPTGQYQKGEFCGVFKNISWNEVITRSAQGYYMRDVKEHLRSKGGGGAGSTDGNALVRPDTGNRILGTDRDDDGHPASVKAFEVFVNLIPKEWGLGDVEWPEKWVFTVTDDFETLLGAQPHGALHAKYPYGVLESEVEGHGAWNRGMPDILEGVQNSLDWLINTHMFNVRAAMNNQFILDPSKIVAKDAKDAGPGFVWRLRPEAYGQDIRSFLYQVPVQDMTRGHVADMSVMTQLGERATGVNDQIQGALAASNRKTATEVRTSTGFGVNRLKTVSEYMSATGFAAHSQRLVQNSQQYYRIEKKLKIVGNLAQDAGAAFFNVTPDAIQGFYDFIPVDGTMPVDRLAQANLWKEILNQMASVPALLAQFDLGKIFNHVAVLSGVRNINQFRLQVGSPADLAQAAQAGNVVPIRPNDTRGGSIPAGNPAPTPSPTFSA